MDDTESTPVGDWRNAGAELRRLRIERKLSLAALAGKVHYSKSYLSKLENGDKRLTSEVARSVDETLGTGGVLAALVPARENPGPDLCPYPGLAAFGPEQARWFFGRATVTAGLVARLDERLSGAGPLALVAPSGAGKSSLLAAGLIPALASGALPGSRDWLVVATTPGAHPLSTLVDRVVAVSGADPAAAAAGAGDSDQFATFLSRVVADGRSPEAPSSPRIVLIIDQFEEIFTECQQEIERQAFIAALSAVAQGATALVVLGVRADFYGRCLGSRAVSAALEGHLPLQPMSADQLREVITLPARAEALDLEPGLVELLLRDLGVTEDDHTSAASYDPGALPLLAHALRATWQQRDGQMLTVAGYRRTGGIAQALATTAERAYARLSLVEQQVAQQVLLRLVNVSDQGPSGDTRRRLPRARLDEALPLPESAKAIESVLEVFGRARLLTFDTASVEITHEALLRAWPRLRQWVDTDRAGNLIRQELEDAAAVWDRDRRDTAGLYRGSRLEAACTWATSTSHQANLSTAASAFLAASTAQERRSAMLRRAVLVVLSVLALIASGAAVVALQQNTTAQRERDTATFNQIIAQADRLRGADVSLAAQLDLTAYRMRPTPALYTALVTDANAILSTPLTGHADSVRGVVFSPDGHTMATTSTDRTVRLWNVTDPTRPTPLGPPLTGHTNTVGGVVFSPDGHTLATTSDDQTVRLWNLTDPAHPTSLGPPLIGHTDIVYSVAFTPDGHTLASGSADQTVRLWNLTDPAHPTPLGPPLTGHTNTVRSVAFSPDGHTLASGSADQTVRLWNLTDPAHPTPLGEPLTGHTNTVGVVAFSPDGHILASGSADQTVRLWNVTDPAHPTPLGPTLTGHTNYVTAVMFSPDGHTLASASNDHTVRLWNIPAALLTGHTSPVNAVVFSPDGHTLATASNDHTVRLWNITDPARPLPLGQPLTSHTSPVNAVVFSPDGHTLATASNDHTVRLWNITDPADPLPLGQPLTGHTSPVNAVVFSPDGHTLATASSDQTVRLWNVTDPADPLPLGPPLSGHTNPVNAVAFSPDGHTLVSGSRDQTLRLWNVTDPARTIPLGPGLTGHTNTVRSLAFSPDGHTLASGSSDQTVRLWNLTDPTHPMPLGRPLTGHTNWVSSVAFSPDGHTLSSGSVDQTVRLWRMNVDQATQRICATTGNTLTLVEWKRYVSPDLLYHPPCP